MSRKGNDATRREMESDYPIMSAYLFLFVYGFMRKYAFALAKTAAQRKGRRKTARNVDLLLRLAYIYTSVCMSVL